MTDHLTDPIAYLYEELSPEDMAAACDHIAACPECRQELAAIRDAVKAYRDLPRPAVPAGLAARAAAAANTATRAHHFQDEPGPGWRARLFHPAWTVAAGVLFVCAVLIHLSPRKDLWFNRPGRSAPPAWDAAESPLELRRHATYAEPAVRSSELERLPAAPALEKSVAPAASAPPPPPAVLSEAEAWDVVPAAPAPSPAPAPMTKVDPAIGSISDLFKAAGRRQQERDGAREVDDEPEEMETPVLSVETLEQLSRQSTDESDAVVVLPEGFQPPRVVARPEPVDQEQAARELVFLIGLQLGHGDFAEARTTIELLRNYTPERADKLIAVLEAMEQAAQPEVEPATPLPQAEPEPKPEPELVEPESEPMSESVPAPPAPVQTSPVPAASFTELRDAVAEPRIIQPPSRRFKAPDAPARGVFSTDPYVRGE